MTNKSKHYERLFRKNNDTGRVIIDIVLEDYLEFFHEWDNSVFKKRDIHSEIAEFLDICLDDIPFNKKLEIAFSIKEANISENKENIIRISYGNYYSSLYRLESRKIKRLLRMAIISFSISLMLLTTYALLIDKPNTVGARVLIESLLIGGWVFTWEAVHTLFIDIHEPFRRNREIKRLLDADISFIYLSK